MGDRLSEKVFIIGIDGMDPKFTRYMLRKGRMPNVKRLIEVGGMREDLILLGNHPTVTPPMWTTLSTGATPRVHGIHAFSRTDFKDGLEYSGYNLDSRYCKAEQLWDVTAAAGIKTLVFNWPGCSWPPTSNNPNLHVVDGQQPSNPGSGVATVDAEFMFVADIKTEDVLFRRKCASDSHIPCVINDLAPEPQTKTLQELTAAATKKSSQDSDGVSMPKFKSINLTENDGERGLSTSPFDVVLSPIKEAYGWANSPEGAKEFTMLFSGGLLRRVGLILKNELGIYDTVALYKSKKETEPIIVMGND